jgi:hypothetical protein
VIVAGGTAQARIALITDPVVHDHPHALKAFRFASTTMRLQRQHTTIAALRESTSATYPEAHRS